MTNEEIREDLKKTLDRVREEIGEVIVLASPAMRHLINTAGPRAVTALLRRSAEVKP